MVPLNTPQTVLVVEDEASIASFVSLYLKNAGYDVHVAENGESALDKAESQQPSLIVLDLMLPDIDGIEVCRRIRRRSDVPILMLTARDEDVDKIIGLEVGADDYLTKPFNPRELVARVKSILRRSTPDRKDVASATLQHGDLHIDAGRREVKVGDEEIKLAPKEFDLLWELLDHRGLVLTRDQLLERVWGYTFAGDTRTVDVHVRQLRRKLGDASPIVTVWGVGYKVAPAKEAAAPRRSRCSSSLRFRLPALFLAGIALPGSSRRSIAFGLFRNYTQNQARERAAARGDRADAALRASRRDQLAGEGNAAAALRARAGSSAASGNRLFYVGDAALLRPGTPGCAGFPQIALVDFDAILQGKTIEFEFTPPGENRDVPRRRASAPSRDADLRRRSSSPHRRRSSATRRCGSCSTARGRAPRRAARGGGARLVPLGTDHEARSAPRAGGRRGRARAATTSQVPEVAGRDEIADLADRSADGRAARRAEELERNFLMTVSHELRTPLTAIRGHVEALREGLAEDPEARAPLAGRDRGRGGPARAARRRRARPREARRAPLHGAPRGGRHGAARRAGVRGVRRGGAGGARSTTAATSRRRR